MSKVLVTGGAGYIGSHMCVELLQNGFEVVVLDNLANSSAKSLEAAQRITQKELDFVKGDLRDKPVLAQLFEQHEISAVLHFGGLKAVGESVANPLWYYDNNVNGTLCLIEAMTNANVKTLVFSSTATVYGIPETMPITENFPTNPINPYGQTKLTIEHMLRDLHTSDPSWSISMLRYFNPVGADSSGEIGENPNGVPNNLMPYVSQVAIGELPRLRIFGDDYPTHDGTGIRDYIHVVDLVRGHLHALEFITDKPKLAVHNLGTGTGYSVYEVLRVFEQASGKRIPFEVVERRSGDAAESFSDPTKANEELDWRAEYDLRRMCVDSWRWQEMHPHGY
ncbi:MAG: UDP-glucose 4-epimerase GalE [Gammaproteobacteria bacterium]|nr:UDP-glucose 4-epimerase GalE [Gammaproteobacteria bacterium]